LSARAGLVSSWLFAGSSAQAADSATLLAALSLPQKLRRN